MSIRQSTVAAPPFTAKPRPASSAWKAVRELLSADVSFTVGLAMCAVFLFAVLIGPFLLGIDPQESAGEVLAPPSPVNLLGTDSIGRDVLARLLVGARSSIIIALASTALTMVLGSAIGVTAGYFRGWVNWTEMRLIDILLSMPPLLVAIAVLAAIGPSVTTLIAVLVLTYTSHVVRVIRASSMQVAERGFIDSARISGLHPMRIIWLHVLPNIRGVLIVQATITVAHMLLVETILSFLGLGVQPPTPSLGFMVAEGRQWMELAPGVVLAPGLVIVFAVAAFTFVGQGLDQLLGRDR